MSNEIASLANSCDMQAALELDFARAVARAAAKPFVFARAVIA